MRTTISIGKRRPSSSLPCARQHTKYRASEQGDQIFEWTRRVLQAYGGEGRLTLATTMYVAEVLDRNEGWTYKLTVATFHEGRRHVHGVGKE